MDRSAQNYPCVTGAFQIPVYNYTKCVFTYFCYLVLPLRQTLYIPPFLFGVPPPPPICIYALIAPEGSLCHSFSVRMVSVLSLPLTSIF